MQGSKPMSWANDFDRPSKEDESSTENRQAANDEHSAEADGWQQYRKWISKAPVPRKRRMGVDPSLYTWKGYRNWSEQVKRNWSDS